MKLSQKTLLSLAAAGFISFVLSFWVLRAVVFSSFIDLEREWAQTTTETALAAIELQLDTLTRLNIEYSDWNETVDFLHGDDEGYVEEYVSLDAIDSLDADAMAFFQKDGSLRVSLARTADGDGVFLDHLSHPVLDRMLDVLAVADDPSGIVRGVVQSGTTPLLVVSRGVRNTDGSGPLVGSLLLVRELNAERVASLRESLNVDLGFVVAEGADLPPEVRSFAKGEFGLSDQPFLETGDSNLRSYSVIPDIRGQLAYVMTINLPRRISAAGAAAINIALLFLAASVVLFMMISGLSLKRLVIRPVELLTRYVERQELGEKGTVPGLADRDDELGTLQRQIDSLIGQRERAQEQLRDARDDAIEASKAKSAFLATMSHEIRTPINGVLGMTELLLHSTRLDRQQREYAQIARQSGESLLQVINDILDLSKIEAGRIELDHAPFNIRLAVEDSIEMLAETAQRKGLDLIVDIPPAVHEYVVGDSARLRQVLVNLVSNAVKFTDSGEVVVSVRDGDHLPGLYEITVRDTGIGIPVEKAGRIFEPFRQGDSSTTRRYGGTGLGLTICQQLVELMGGGINLASEPGRGSEFRFTARLARDEVSGQYPASGLLAGRRVLVVDDNATNRRILLDQLTHWGIAATAASDAQEALAELEQHHAAGRPVELVLLDMHMPESDGTALSNEIRDRVDCGNPLQVMLSSLSRSDCSDSRSDIKLEAWLTKPVRQARLQETLVSVFSSAARQSEEAAVFRGEQQHTDAGSLKILLAEDFFVNQLVARTMLENMGHEVTVAENGLESLELYKNGEFDLVFMDCLMPEMDGYEATRHIRLWERQEDRARAPIVALTANALEGDRERCIAAGMDDYLSKPFTIEQLQEVLLRSIAATGSADARATS